MPIFQADLQHDYSHYSAQRSHDPSPDNSPSNSPQRSPEPRFAHLHHPSSARRLSEESIRTELCDGPVPDSPPGTPVQRHDDEAAVSSRAELIERLKRGESPTWVPNRHLESLYQQQSSPTPKSPRTPSRPSSLLPSPHITPENDNLPETIDEDLRDPPLRDPPSIERPRSALHSGDFTAPHGGRPDSSEVLRTQAAAVTARLSNDNSSAIKHPWAATSPPRDFRRFYQDDDEQSHHRSQLRYASSRLSLSPSISSSFAYQPPTSPLVQSESNEDLGISSPSVGFLNRNGPRSHTLYTSNSPPQESPSHRSPFLAPSSPPSRRPCPYQAHQPRRSLVAPPTFHAGGTSPQGPALMRTRRLSFGSDSPSQLHASMVGSYEESILRGRMSTTPSKPLDFLAQIGVLGMGKCKSSLRCPAHVTLPFPAVYYSYGTTSHGRSQTDDGPSPYVGQIDLENGLPNTSEESRSRRKAHSRYADKVIADSDAGMSGQGSDREGRRPALPKRRSGEPKAPPGGSYRIPEKGQIQIIIKNPNKTAVKLFLVPYDLTGMEPGTKTFIRQRSYSAGPIIDGIPKGPEADAAADKPVLRYLVHLHICSPSKGRFYLYKSIRVVFANRVPDGKEKLRNETTWLEPRFTPYKPVKVMHPPPGTASSGSAAIMAAEKAYRRRSSGLPVGQASQHMYDVLDGLGAPARSSLGPLSPDAAPASTSVSGSGHTRPTPIDPIPVRFSSRSRVGSGISDTMTTMSTATIAEQQSSESSPVSHSSTNHSLSSSFSGSARYAKLNKGDLGYGGNAFSPSHQSGQGGPAGLLSQRLRSLGVKNPEQLQDENNDAASA